MIKRLGVNVDHVATLRQARGTNYPDPIFAALLAEMGGADQITIHLREDRRHIQDRDLELMRKVIKTKLNLEMAATSEMMEIAQRVVPDTITLVPERREELTTEGGLDVISNRDQVSKVVYTFKNSGIRVSVFVDPDINQIKEVHRLGIDCIELHTGRYADSTNEKEMNYELYRIKEAALFAKKLNMSVFAGHGLNYRNILKVAAIKEIEEFNIGHSIIARSVFVGIKEATREMKELILLGSSHG